MLPSKNSQKQQSEHLYHRRTHSAPSTPTTNSAHQMLRRREQEDSPPLPPSNAIYEDRAYFNSPQPATKSLTQQRSRSNGSHRPNNPRITYESPRLFHSDTVLFPASKQGPLHNTSYLQTYEARYQYIQSLQGGHRLVIQTNTNVRECHANDMSTLCIHYSMIHHRKISPKSVQLGILPQCARRIKSLHCPILPQQLPSAGKSPRVLLKAIISWIDMFVHTFPNLQHLYIQPPPLETDSPNSESVNDCDITNSLFSSEEMKLFHTFIVYRMPNLLTIDGISITAESRKEAMLLKRVKVQSVPKCTSSPIRNKRMLSKSQPVTFSLLDGMDDDENNDPSQEDNIQATETAVEVRQPTSEKKESTHQLSTDRVLRSPDAYSNPHFFAASRRKPSEEEQWEYVSVGESSVHAMGACSSWTTACGSLSSALPYFLQKRATADPDRLKMKLLQNRKRMIQGNIPASMNQTDILHDSGKECRRDTLPLERDQPTKNKPTISPSMPVPPSRSNLARMMPNAPTSYSCSQKKVILGTAVPEALSVEASNGIQALRITTNQIFTSRDADPVSTAVPPTPRVSTSRARISSEALSDGMTKQVEQTYDLSRTRSSPSKLPSSQRDAKEGSTIKTASLTVQTKSGALPPPCPGGIRRKVSTVANRSANTTRPNPSLPGNSQGSCTTTAAFQPQKDYSHTKCHPSTSPWRDAMSLRTFSVLDDDDDDYCNDGFVYSDDEDMLPLPSIRM